MVRLTLVAAAAVTPALALSAAIAGVPDAVGPMALASIAGTAAYLALFVFIGTAVRRAAWWSLGIVLIGERLLGAVLAGIAQLSPQWLATMVYAGLVPDSGSLERAGMPMGGAAVARLVVLTLVFIALAVWRIRRLRPTSTDE